MFCVQALRTLEYQHAASVMMNCGRRLLQEIYDAQQQIRRPVSANETVRNWGKE